MRLHLTTAFVLVVGFVSLPAIAAMEDDPVIYALDIDLLEIRDDFDSQAWELQAWAGRDINKVLLRAEGETEESATEEFETQVLWNRAVARFWDLQLGWRRDWALNEERDWFTAGLTGLAPGFIELEMTGFISEEGAASIRVKASYEIVLTQKLKLEPKIEMNWFSEADPVNGIGRGIESTEAGLRLAYAVRRNIKPYIGIHWEHLSGSTARFASEEGESDSELAAVLGLKWSF